MLTQKTVWRIGQLAILGTLIGVASVALGAAGVGPLTPVFYRPISIAENGGVVGVDLRAIPEGPPFPGVPLASIERYIPDPLPAPLNNWFCDGGGNLTVYLGNGREVTYGPCRRPASIDHLWSEMIYVETQGRCAPRCGPGDAHAP